MVKSAPKLGKIDFFKPIVISILADAQGIWDMVFLQRNLQKIYTDHLILFLNFQLEVRLIDDLKLDVVILMSFRAVNKYIL